MSENGLFDSTLKYFEDFYKSTNQTEDLNLSNQIKLAFLRVCEIHCSKL